MDITAKSGPSLGASLREVKVAIARSRGRAPTCASVARREGPTAAVPPIPLRVAPAASRRAASPPSMGASGDGRCSSSSTCRSPISRSTRSPANTSSAATTLALTRVLPPLEEAQGQLRFTESSLAVREVRARIFGGTVSL